MAGRLDDPVYREYIEEMGRDWWSENPESDDPDAESGDD